MNTYRNLTDINTREGAPTWGARMISNSHELSLVHDRQAVDGEKEDVDRLAAALNQGPLRKAIADTLRKFQAYQLNPNGEEPFDMYRDDTVLIRGNPNASYGYLYVTACFVSDLIEEE